MHLGSETVLETLQLIEKGKAITTIQEKNPDVKTAYKLNKENCKIDWSQSGKTIFNLIRGFISLSCSLVFILKMAKTNGMLKYMKLNLKKKNILTIGKITTTKKEIFIATKDGVLKISKFTISWKEKNVSS